jgi:hypothetical protein
LFDAADHCRLACRQSHRGNGRQAGSSSPRFGCVPANLRLSGQCSSASPSVSGSV